MQTPIQQQLGIKSQYHTVQHTTSDRAQLETVPIAAHRKRKSNAVTWMVIRVFTWYKTGWKKIRYAIYLIKTNKKKLFWYWILYQCIKGIMTTALIWIPLLLAWLGLR